MRGLLWSTLGGIFHLEIDPPPKGDGLLTGWMFDPAMELNAQVVLWDGEGKMLRVIKLYNAYCVSLEGQFNATGLGLNRRSSLRDTLYISPQAVDINGLFHDNDWPGPSPIIDWDWTTMNQQCNPDAKAKKEPSALSETLHTALDVVGMIPVVGELADAANALLYAGEGDYANAAMSAAAMIPLAGNVVGAAKLARRGAKLVGKVRGLKKAQKVLKGGLKKIDGYVTGTHEALIKAKKKDSHHVIQDAAMKDIPGYNRQKAPTIQLEGPSTRKGSAHYHATQTQRKKGGGTYGAERKLAYRALREAGVPKQTAKKVIRQTDKYFRKLGVELDTPTRIPGNRPR